MADTKRDVLESGQAIVEYVLLIVVVLSLFTTLYKSQAFQENLGADAEMFKTMAKQMEFSYRYGSSGVDDTFSDYGGADHELYYNINTGSSRFTAPIEAIDEQ